MSWFSFKSALLGMASYALWLGIISLVTGVEFKTMGFFLVFCLSLIMSLLAKE